MDPVSTIGLAASLVNLMDVAMRAIAIMNNLKGAIKEQSILVQEVTGLLPFLSSLKSRIVSANEKDPWFARVLVLGAPNGAIAQLDAAIKDLSYRLEKMYGRSKVSRSLGWLLKKEECNAILLRIERSKTLITAELQGDVLFVTPSVLTSDL